MTNLDPLDTNVSQGIKATIYVDYMPP